MDQQSLDNLREALRYSPENIPLRLHLAQTLMQMRRFQEAAEEYQKVLLLRDDGKAKLGLARAFFEAKEFSKCIVILEEFINSEPKNIDALILYSKALFKEDSIADAIKYYQKALQIKPDFYDEELESQLKVTEDADHFEENEINLDFMENPKINFSDVGGMESVKKEIALKIIQPLKHPDLYKAYGKKAGGGILLYGPPGCGKTYLARATAGEVNAGFISVSLNDILDMWIGSSEKNLHEVFETARANTPCVLFFDEIDALGASRSDMKKSAGRHLINQFLQELDGVENDNEGVLILGATNTPWHLDPAFRRPGRFDRIIFVPPPDDEARAEIFRIKLKDKPLLKIDYENLAKGTREYSGADIEAIVDIAIEDKLTEAFKDGVPQPISTKDLVKAAQKHKASTKEWFSSARNFALYANDSGLYDDILNYLKIKK